MRGNTTRLFVEFPQLGKYPTPCCLCDGCKKFPSIYAIGPQNLRTVQQTPCPDTCTLELCQVDKNNTASHTRGDDTGVSDVIVYDRPQILKPGHKMRKRKRKEKREYRKLWIPPESRGGSSYTVGDTIGRDVGLRSRPLRVGLSWHDMQVACAFKSWR